MLKSDDYDDDESLDLKELESQVMQLVDRGEVEEKLRMQLFEMEMLQSMYSNPGEFCVDNHAILADINEYLDGRTDILPCRLDYTINLTIDPNIKAAVCVNLAHDYPSSEPDVYVRSDQLSREQQHLLNADLARFVSDQERDEICICPSLNWLQENVSLYLERVAPPKKRRPPKVVEDDHSVFARSWIYSHHIYSKSKRREILELSHEYHISGFCLPGKPGIICVEGTAPDCEEWWQRVKSMNWKRIVCKKLETEKTKSKEELASLRKFSLFEEISFESGKNKSREYHMDMGELFRYLQEHKCEDIFREYFGISGRTQLPNPV